MTIKIVTDSTCDLPPDVISELDITVVPCYINFPEQSYLDGVEITKKEFYEKLPEYPVPPKTSAPSIGTFARIYQNLFEKGASAVLSIHISSALSGVFNVANLAAEAMEGFIVKTLDSGQLTLGTGLIVETAARAAREGKSLEEILTLTKNFASRTYTYAVVDTLEYLRRSGRLSQIQSNLGTLLQIKPILHMHNGKYEIGAIRTTKRSLDRMINVLNSLGSLDALSIVHTNVPEKAEHFAQMIKEFFPGHKKSYTVDVTPVIGTHIGPGTVGFVAVQSES